MKKLICIVMAVCAAVVSRADETPVYALAQGSNDGNALKTKAWWVDADTGTAAPYSMNENSAAGMEFAVTNGLVMRTISGYVNIYGHLTIGSTESAGFVRNKHYDSAINWRGGITAVKGGYEATGSGGGTHEYNLARIDGPIQVASPASDPFVFGGSIDGQNQFAGVWLYSNMSGAEGTGIVMGNPNQAKNPIGFMLAGDNSSYLGSIHFATSGTEFTNVVASATALGGAPSVLVDDAVTITTKGKATLRFTSDVGECEIPATRGLFFNGVEGGTVYPRTFQIEADEGANVTFAGPIKANGQCSGGRNWLTIEKTGVGTVTFAGEVKRDPGVTQFDFNVLDGRIILGSASAMALTNEVSSRVWLKSPDFMEYAVSGYSFSSGAGVVVRHSESGTGTFVLDGTCSISETPISVKVDMESNGYDGLDLCVMKVPVSVRALSEADFIDVDGESFNTRFRIEESDGVQSVYLVRAANDTIAHLTFDADLANHARPGVLDDPSVTRGTPVISADGVFNPLVTSYGDRGTVIRNNLGALNVNGAVVEYKHVSDLMRFSSQTIEFYIKADMQLRWQGVIALKNDASGTGIAWYFLFDNGVLNLSANEKLKVSFCLVSGEGAAPSGTSNPILGQVVGDDRWHHVAYTFAKNAENEWKTDVQMFIDHKRVASNTVNGRVNLVDSNDARFYIGRDDRNQPFNGWLDEFRISRGVLTPDKFLSLRSKPGLAIFVR